MEQVVVSERTVEDPTIGFEAPNLETDANEGAYVEQWGDDLYMLVHSNQDVIVACPWIDNAEVTLGTAMTAYEHPSSLTAEDEPFLISLVNELLASRVIGDEEPEDPVVEVETEVEVDEEPAADKNEAELQEDEATSPKEPKLKSIDDKVFKKAVDPVATKRQSPVQHVAEVRQPEKSSVRAEEPSRSETVVEVITSKPATDISTEQAQPSKPTAPEGESAAGQREVETEQPAGVLKIVKPAAPEVAPTPERPPVAESGKSRAGSEDEIPDFPPQPLPVEVFAEPEPAAQDLEIEHLTALAEGAALSVDETVGASEDQPIPVSTHDHLDSDETEDPGVEAVTARPPGEVDAVAELILAEYIERSDSQSTEVANHYLDKIIEVAVEVQAFDGEDATDETRTTEELEELFIELFDEMGIPHTPELIEHLVRRTIEQRVAKNKELEDEEIADDMQQGGLSTKLKKPSVGHATLNDVIVHDRLISKIALELCGFKASFSLN